MAVALRGYTPLAVTTAGKYNLTIPAAAVAGDLALIYLSEGFNNPIEVRAPGWTYLDKWLWWKYLTAADVAAGSVPVTGRTSTMVVLSGAAGPVVSRRSKSSILLPAGGAALWQASMSGYNSGNPTDSALSLGATVTEADGWKHRIAFGTAPAGGTLTLDNVHRNASVYSFSITPPATPPAPLVTAPDVSANVDRTLPVPIRFQHRGQMPMDMARVGLRWSGSSNWGWVQQDGSVSAFSTDPPTDIINSTGEVVINPLELTGGGVQHELVVYTHDATGWSEASTVRSFTVRTPPTVVATLTTTAEDLSPTVSWVTTAGTGSQVGWQVRVTPAAATNPNAPLYDTGMIPGDDTSFQVPNTIPWTNGGSYKAWVRVADSALMSVWDDSPAATVSWTPPATPATIGFTASTPPTVDLTGLETTALRVEVEWSLDGITWEHAVTTDGDGIAARSVPVPLAEYGVPRWYRARIVDDVDGVPLASAWTTTAAAATSLDRCSYLVSRVDQSDYVKVDIAEDAPRVDLGGVTVSSGLDATESRVDYSVSAGMAGSTDFNVDTLAERDALAAWLDEHREPFWIRWPAERHGAGYVHVPSMLVARATARETRRFAQYVVQHRNVTFGWVTQDPS